ncbi:MAG: hypothetical protein ISR67_04565 [Sulfurimonas sp.]|nr:hypothetical protein [Sulfurimonas sp.]
MKSLTKILFITSGVLLLLLPESLSALAMFSKQTGKSCTACHTQNMPKLNSYGREFSLSGYAFYDKNNADEPLVEGSSVPLGLPSTLNVSLVVKGHYIKTSQEETAASGDLIGDGSGGEYQILNDSGVYLGGRISDNFGALVSVEGDSSDKSNIVYNGKIVMAYPTMDGYGGMSLSSTELNGIFSGMENYNTGLNGTLKQFENAYATNAAQATGIGSGPATSLQAYYGSKNVFVTAGLALPTQNSEGIDAGSSVLPFWRISYELPINSWNFMIGAYGFKGDTKASDQSLNGGATIDGNANLVNVYKDGYGFDLEVSGAIFDMSTMLTLNHVQKNIVEVDPLTPLTSYNLQNTDNKGTSAEIQINPIEALGLKVAYLNYENRESTATNQKFIKNYNYDAYTVGASYSLRENILLGVDYSRYEPESTIGNYDNFYVTAVLVF